MFAVFRGRMAGLVLLMVVEISAFALVPPGAVSAKATRATRQVTCLSGPAFSSAILRKAPALLADSADAIDQQIAASSNDQNFYLLTSFESFLRNPIRFLGIGSGNIRVYMDGKNSDFLYLVDGKSLRFLGTTRCQIRGAIGDRPALEWEIHDKAPKITSATTSLRILVQDYECGGGDLLTPRILTSVKVTTRTMEVTISSRPLILAQPTIPEGTPLLGPDEKPVTAAVGCDGSLPSDITITLPVALGKRQLINASLYPAKPASRYILKKSSPDPPPLPNFP